MQRQRPLCRAHHHAIHEASIRLCETAFSSRDSRVEGHLQVLGFGDLRR